MGELARQPGCPELSKTPMETLTPRPGEGFTTANKYIWPVGGFIAGILAGIVTNVNIRRPAYAGAPYILILSACFGYSLTYFRDFRFAEKAENDAILRHYISLHPEEFPPYEKVRYADVYKPFYPVR